MNNEESNQLQDTTPSKAECNWAMFTHLSVFSTFIVPFGFIIAPIVMWQMKKNEMPFAVKNAKQCVNFQLSTLIYYAISGILSLIGIGFLMMIVIGVAHIILTVLAAIKANDGIVYKYPATINFIK